MSATLRLQNELKTIQKTRKYGFYAHPRENNFLIWDCQFYKDGYFYRLSMNFNKNYPSSPPNVNFKHKVYHPNVYDSGAICLDILSSKWQASLTVNDVINGLIQLLDYPNPSSPANCAAASLYRKNREKYLETVKDVNEENCKKYSIVGMLE